MGDPRRPRRTYSTPRSPWRSDQLAQELYLVGSYGLRNKRELYKAQSQLSSIESRRGTSWPLPRSSAPGRRASFSTAF